MNRLRQTVFRQLIIALSLVMSIGLLAQKESKSYEERFIVANDAILEINTSYADIEFETWEKEEVSVTAIITLEGATKEEAEAYFEDEPFEMIGNTKKVSIKSRGGMNRFLTNHEFSFPIDHAMEVFEFPEVTSFVTGFSQITPFPEIPRLPVTSNFSFDYEAYKKGGEKYMRKWQKDFEKSFNKKDQKRLEEWATQVAEQALEMEKSKDKKKMNAYLERREALMEKRTAKMEERAVELQERLRERETERDELSKSRDSLRNYSNIFFLSDEGDQKKYKIKKTIKIKLPRSTRIKMEVRHGEVKLAENTKNLNAKLSYSSLLATTIDGLDTNVSCSYTPIQVLRWNDGQLTAQYSDDVSLAEVNNMQLQATSSEVVIDKLLNSAYIQSSFGPLKIIEIGSGFKELDISLKNAELNLHLPNVAAKIYYKGNSSSLKKPVILKLIETVNGNTKINRGFHLNESGNRSITITSEYSDVVLNALAYD